MGEDEWTHRESGSATGSMVPPPAIPDEPPPFRPPLPRRQPKASGHQRAADADHLITPIWWVSRSAGPDLSTAGPTRTQAGLTQAGLTQAGPTQAQPSRRNLGPGERQLQVAEPPAAALPELTDNVRYLFKPVLTRTSLVIAPGDGDVKPDAEGPSAESTVASAGVKTRPKSGDLPASEPTRRVNKAATAGSHRRGPAAGPGSKLRRRLTWVAAVLVVLTAVGTAFAVVKHGSAANSPGARHTTRGGGWGTVPGRALPGRALPGIIACDEVMCTEPDLIAERVPYWPTSVTTARVGGHEIVQVRFSRLSPIEFLNGQ